MPFRLRLSLSSAALSISYLSNFPKTSRIVMPLFRKRAWAARARGSRWAASRRLLSESVRKLRALAAVTWQGGNQKTRAAALHGEGAATKATAKAKRQQTTTAEAPARRQRYHVRATAPAQKAAATRERQRQQHEGEHGKRAMRRGGQGLRGWMK